MKNYKFILVAFLIGITTFSVLRYSLSLKEKYDLLRSLERVKEQVDVLQIEKQNLLQELEKEKGLKEQLDQENLRLKDNLEASKDRLAKLFGDFEKTQKTIEQLDSQISLLKAENTALREEKDNLQLERDDLEARLNSLPELKKAIRELKIKMRQVKKEIEKTGPGTVIEGNRGYLIKDGKSTYPLYKVRIEVVPLSTEE